MASVSNNNSLSLYQDINRFLMYTSKNGHFAPSRLTRSSSLYPVWVSPPCKGGVAGMDLDFLNPLHPIPTPR